MHELSIVERDRRHGRAARRRAARVARDRADRAPAPGGAGLARVLLRDRAPRHRAARARRSRSGAVPARLALPATASTSGRSSVARRSGARRARAADVRGRSSGDELEVESIEVEEEERRMHRTKVRVVEDALDANDTIARANRDDFDRAGVTVVNLMSAPGAGKTTLLERVAPRPRADARWACSRATSRAASTPTGSRRCTSRSRSSTPTPGFGGECHLDANMVRSALPATLPLDEIDLLVIENVGNLVCPAEFRVGEDARVMVSLGHRGRGQAAQVPADVPRLRARAGQQDRPAPAPRLRPRPLPAPPRRRAPGRAAHARERADGRGRRRSGATGCPRGPGRARGGRRAAARRPRRSRDRVGELLGAAGPTANERFFDGRGRADRAALPPDGRALRARRAPDRARRGRRPRAPTCATSPSSSSTR